MRPLTLRMPVMLEFPQRYTHRPVACGAVERWVLSFQYLSHHGHIASDGTSSDGLVGFLRMENRIFTLCSWGLWKRLLFISGDASSDLNVNIYAGQMAIFRQNSYAFMLTLGPQILHRSTSCRRGCLGRLSSHTKDFQWLPPGRISKGSQNSS